LDSLLKRAWESGWIEATTDSEVALRESDVSIICVGTPPSKSGHLGITAVYKTAEHIGKGLATNHEFHVVIIRSTVPPGTNDKVARIIEEHSGKRRSSDFEVVSNPEFLREGTAIHDFYHPPYTVIGTSSERAFERVKTLYREVEAPVKWTSIQVAEMIKFVSNSFHALKVVFANEIGNICKPLDIDSHAVMDLLCEDKNLNLSAYYLRPGFAYGGSCLPKDLSALQLFAHDNYLNTPLINSIELSNSIQKKLLVEMIEAKGLRKLGILGLSFKPGTDDLRNSPIVEVTEALIGKGYDVRIYDKNVHYSKLTGRNRQYIDERLPHLAEIVSSDLDRVISHAELLVVANKEDEFTDLAMRHPEKFVIDLVRIRTDFVKRLDNYEGICW